MKLLGITWFAVKLSLAGEIVYYTIKKGPWSKADDSIDFYRKIYGNAVLDVKENIPKEVINELPQLPSVNNMANCAGAMWNKGVKTSIKFIAELPTHVSDNIDIIMSIPVIMGSIASSIDNEQAAEPPSKQKVN